MDGGAWWAAVHGVARSRTQLSDFTFTFHFHALGKERATHSSVLAWRIPGMGGAWWAAISGVTQSRTRLKRLSSSSSKYNYFLLLCKILFAPLGKSLGKVQLRRPVQWSFSASNRSIHSQHKAFFIR